jgi:ubiquinone/menaquinone biosynthesis C-methylase UbiE
MIHNVSNWRHFLDDIDRVLKSGGFYLNAQWVTPPARMEFESYFRSILSKYESPSVYPFQGTFPCAPRYADYSFYCFPKSFSLLEDLLHCLTSYRCSWSFIFSKLSCGTVAAIFVGHVLADLLPETNHILAFKVTLEGESFEPNFSVNN